MSRPAGVPGHVGGSSQGTGLKTGNVGSATPTEEFCVWTLQDHPGIQSMRALEEKHFSVLRRHMVEWIAIQAELASEELGKSALEPRVLTAMGRVPRHRFVAPPLASLAYHDTPLPIGFDKTVSQPFIVALMTDLLDPQPNESVLEVGTGLGYHTAVLADLAGTVFSVEIVEEFAAEAEARLQQLGFHNVRLRFGDGSRGWAEHALFDKILVAAGVRRVPPALIGQLKPGGRLVLPLGSADSQRLTMLGKTMSGEPNSRQFIPVRFAELETVS